MTFCRSQFPVQEQMTKYGLDYNEVAQLRRTLLGLGDKKPVEITAEVETPNVIGMPLNKASNIIRKAQLSIGESTYQDDIKPKDSTKKCIKY
ncbi:MAG: PASTA domain-containing protein [Nitrososphaeraceae archaeon]